VVSGENGQPVGGARVVVAGRVYDADASGQVTVAERAPVGSLVDVLAQGFFDRQTLARSDGNTRLLLWPSTTAFGLSEDYTSALVYTAGTANPPAAGSSPLLRLRQGTTQAFVSVSPEIAQDDRANFAHQSAVDMLNAAMGGRVVYSLAPTRPASGVVFDTRVDLADSLCASGRRILAYTSVSLLAGEIVGGRVVYCGIDVARTSTVAHELGHTTGLQHSLDPADLMAAFKTAKEREEFGPREILTMNLLLERRGGNRFPDNDRDVAPSARGTLTIVCP
jgi:hypothetical protein